MHKIKKKRYTLLFFFILQFIEDTYMNKQDHDEPLNQGLTQQEIDSLTQKGFTKEEMMQTHLYNNEIKKGSNFIAWLVDIITWLIP